MEQIELLGSSLVDLFTTYGYFILFPLFVIDGSVPGVIAGFLASLGIFNPYILFGIHILADFITDTVAFFAPRYMLPYARKFDVVERTIKQFEENNSPTTVQGKKILDTHFGKIFFFTKTFPMPQLFFSTMIAASLSGISSKRFFKTFFIVQPLWSAFLISFGYFFGNSIQDTDVLFSWIGIFLLILLITMVIYYYYVRDLIQTTALGKLFAGKNGGKTTQEK